MTVNNTPPFLTIFPKKNDIYCFRKLKELTTSFPSEQKHFTGATVIDSNLHVYKLREAIKAGWGNWFYGINLLYKERLIKLEFVVEEIQTLTLEEAKGLLSRTIETRPFGRFMQSFFGNKKRLVEKIAKTSSVDELMNLFLEDGD